MKARQSSLDYVIAWRWGGRGGDSCEIGRPRSRGWNFRRRLTRRVGGLENWTIFMDVICVSSLIRDI